MAALFWTSAHVNGFLVLDRSRKVFLYNARRQTFVPFVQILHLNCENLFFLLI